MKTILFAAALTLGGAAIAQTADQTQPADSSQPSGETVDDPSQATGPQGVTQQGTDPNGTATAPAGTNQAPTGEPAVASANQQAAFTSQPAAGNYPPCSRTVTDSCVQTYERGVRRPRR